MRQVEFTLSEPLIEFLSHYRQYGYKDKSAMIQAALLRLQHDIEARQLRESAALYAEVYAEDGELQELTVSALDAWPE
jgi:Arc/MetJ-type ribon-helix-helix transcriptional regulator